MIDDIHDEVRTRYAAAARAVGGGGDPASGAGSGEVACCGGAIAETTATAPGRRCCGDTTGCGVTLYPAEDLAALPVAAREASLGCGNPLTVADLRPGATVLDLGSGGGGDVLLSARRVGPTGTVYGLDMTDEMLDLARRNITEAGATNVELRKGTIEQIPLPDASIDVVISNCVINLAADKPAVFAEMFRVLRPGGRVGVTDVVADDSLSPAQRAERGDWTGCIAGALSRSEYVDGLAVAGFTDVGVTLTHQVADRMSSAVIRAVRPHHR